MIELVFADLLKLRKRRGLFWWSLIMTAGSMLAYFGTNAVLHLADANEHGPAGGSRNFDHAMDVLCLTAVVAGALVGTTAGSGDRSAGVFRDLVATGRSRADLLLARVPAALAVIVPMVVAGFVIATAGCFAFASSLPTPTSGTLAWYAAFVLASGALSCVFGFGLAELTGSRGIAIGVLLGWFLAGERLVFSISSLGDARDGLAGVAIDRLRPSLIPGDAHELEVSLATALAVLAAWLVVPVLAGLVRAQTRDA